MALILLGRSLCMLCKQTLEKDDKLKAFPAFLPYDHRYGRFSDAAMHESCFLTDPDHEAVDDMLYVHQKIFEQAWEESKEIPGDLHDKETYIAKAFADVNWPPKNGVVVYTPAFANDSEESEWFWSDKDQWEEFEKAEQEERDKIKARREEAYRREREMWQYARDDD